MLKEVVYNIIPLSKNGRSSYMKDLWFKVWNI